MKFIDKLLEKVGIDKFLHFIIGYACTMTVSSLGIIPMLSVFIVVFVISIIKELLDTKFDWVDILSGMIGSSTSILIYLLI